MIKYQVRSKELIDIVNEIKDKRLIISPYFQRNLIWRMLHKIEFIKTILMGYPFPQIFIAKGTLDIENMQTTSCIVDGQQRMNAVMEYINNKIKVDNKNYADLSSVEKEAFLKYQIPIIDLDISNEDPQIIEIFKRLNRTFYSLSSIEKLATEFAPSEFMLTAKFLITPDNIDSQDDDEFVRMQNDPNIPDSFVEWAKNKKTKHYNKLVLESGIFTSYELSRKVHLMFTLNVMSTIIGDYYNRNDFAMKYLEDYSNEFNQKDSLLQTIEQAANKFLKLRLGAKSYWYNKANAFSLLTVFAKNLNLIISLDEKTIKQKLEQVQDNTPPDYAIAAKEGVNNKKERLIRKEFLENLLLK